MDIKEKLRFCEKFIKENGYPDASIVYGQDSEMIVFSVPNTTAKYPNEKPTISVGFARGSMNGGEIDFDIMQILCFIASGIPADRLIDIQKFCADFNKSMQIGHFGVDFKNESVYFKCAQVVGRDISGDILVGMFDQIFTMILFYFGYSYEILIELSYGVIGYGGSSKRLQERKRMLDRAMAELEGEMPAPQKTGDSSGRNLVVEELLMQLKQANPEILEKANIDMDAVRRKQGKTKKQVSAEDAAMKLLDLAQTERKAKRARPAVTDLPVDIPPSRVTVRDKDTSQYKNQMPSVEMFTRREKRQQDPPLDIAELKRALAIEQEDRAKLLRARRQQESQLSEEITERSVQAREPVQPAKKENPESLVQRLRNWTQNP